MKYLAPLLIILSLVSGCATFQPRPPQISLICKALVGPLKYNTYDPKSKRFAAALLALDLKKRNQIGQALHCPLFRTGLL
jgi:hypothetical protein